MQKKRFSLNDYKILNKTAPYDRKKNIQNPKFQEKYVYGKTASNFDLSSVGTEYIHQKIGQWTELAQNFLHPQNIQLIIDNVEHQLTETFSYPVKITLDSDFSQSFTEKMEQNQGVPFSQNILNTMNTYMIKNLYSHYYAGIRQRDRLDRYFIEGKRMKIMPRPLQETVTHQNVVSRIDDYQLTHPFRYNRKCYLQDIYGIKGSHDQKGIFHFTDKSYFSPMGVSGKPTTEDGWNMGPDQYVAFTEQGSHSQLKI